MNDGNIRYYLKNEIADLEAEIKSRNNSIERWSRNIDDTIKEINNLRVHYTSLLNTSIAYGHEVEEDEQED